EQAHVLNRDHRLIGEGREQLDLLVCERPNRSPAKPEDADWYSLSHEGDAKRRSKSDNFLRIGQLVVWIVCRVLDLHRSTFEQHATNQTFTARLQLVFLETPFAIETDHKSPLLGKTRPRRVE